MVTAHRLGRLLSANYLSTTRPLDGGTRNIRAICHIQLRNWITVQNSLVPISGFILYKRQRLPISFYFSESSKSRYFLYVSALPCLRRILTTYSFALWKHHSSFLLLLRQMKILEEQTRQLQRMSRQRQGILLLRQV